MINSLRLNFSNVFCLSLLTACCGAAKAQIVSTGTGFIVAAEGLIVTNLHVVDGAQNILVKRNQLGEPELAVVVAVDAANDLAVLRINAPGVLPSLNVASSAEVQRGARVFTVGFPRIGIQGSEAKVTDGLISGLSGIKNDPRVFQISIPVQPGNSGGALVALDGKVVGVVSSKLSDSFIARQEGNIPQNVNYAIKSNYLLEVLRPFGIRPKVNQSIRPVRFEALVAQVEAATVLVTAFTPAKTSPTVSQSKPSVLTPTAPIELAGLEFGGIKMYRQRKLLVVEEAKFAIKPTTLQNGDQILRCYYATAQARMLWVDYPVDLPDCVSPFRAGELALLVRRAGVEILAIIAAE